MVGGNGRFLRNPGPRFLTKEPYHQTNFCYNCGQYSLSYEILIMTLYNDLIRQTDKLTPEERLRLIAYLAEQARQSARQQPPARRWQDIKGAAAYPLMDEDAQSWVSRTRQEGDARREQQWRSQP